MKRYSIFLIVTLSLLLAACSAAADPTTNPVDQPAALLSPTGAIVDSNPDNDTTPTGTGAEEAPAAQAEAPEPEAPTTDNDPSEDPTLIPDEAVVQPIEVTYFTPAQGEGPYYTVEKPADRDNDLTVLEGAAGSPVGDVLSFSGVVYDVSGLPVEGIVIEIWQTDASGVYLHPNDPGTDSRDPNFQFYGEAVTGSDGVYSFWTILPGHYEPRPRHIHVKIKYDGQELLTTQFYFLNDPELSDEAMLNQVGENGQYLIIALAPAEDDDGNPILVGERDIILNVDFPNE